MSRFSGWPTSVLLAGILAAALAACGDSEELQPSSPTPTGSANSATSAQVTPTTAPSPVSPTPTSSPRYRNETVGYELTIPPGWRIAETFMQEFHERLGWSMPDLEPEQYVVLTSLTFSKEQQEVDQILVADQAALGLEQWYSFAAGKSVHIYPIGVLYPGVTLEQFLRDVDQAGVVRTNTDVRQETTESGEQVTRLTRHEVDDNGDFLYDRVLVDLGSGVLIVSVVQTADYDQSAFQAIFRSLSHD